MQTLVNLFGRQAASCMRTALLGVTEASQTAVTPRDWYDVLELYYHNNALYQALREAGVASGLSGEAMRALKNPAHRSVEFFASHLWAGALPEALPIVSENRLLEPAVQQLWSWSNWGAQKQVAARRFAMLGDLFVKVRSSGDFVPPDERRVWFQQVAPRSVTDFRKDDRNFITYFRIDVPMIDTDTAGAVTQRWSHVEVWDKATGTYRQWRHLGESVNATVETLTGLDVTASIEELTGVDFIPIVHAPFRDVGDDRGVGCFVPAIDKIDEVNRLATRLHQMGFRNMRNLWASTRTGLDAANRPLPAARVGPVMTAINRVRGGTMYTAEGQVEQAADETVIDLPGATDLKSLVPQLAYGDLLDVLRESMREIESDLPEIQWYRLAEEGAELSGRAIRLKMAPAAKRVEEARGNAETALARLDQMGLSMGQAIGLWSDVGSYDAGDFEHAFAAREIFPLSDLDEAESHRARGQAAQSYTSAGVPLATVLIDVMEKTEAEARKILTMATREADEAMQRAQMMADPRDTEDDSEEDQ